MGGPFACTLNTKLHRMLLPFLVCLPACLGDAAPLRASPEAFGELVEFIREGEFCFTYTQCSPSCISSPVGATCRNKHRTSSSATASSREPTRRRQRRRRKRNCRDLQLQRSKSSSSTISSSSFTPGTNTTTQCWGFLL